MPDLTTPVVTGQTGHATLHTDERNEINSLRSRVSVVEGASAAANPAGVALDSFTGATDDAKLTAALSYVAAQTVKQPILLTSRSHSFTQTRTTFSGMRIMGPEGGFQNSEISSGSICTCLVNLNCGIGSASWLVGTAQTFDVTIANIGFRSSNQATQFYHHPLSAGTSYATNLHSLGFSGFKHVLGNPTDKFSMTLCTIDGSWGVTTTVDTQFTLGGSDSDLFVNGANLGADNTNWPGAGKPLMLLQDLGKSNIGPVYFTADNGWIALRVTGGTNYGIALNIRGARFEGRNPTDPSTGHLVKIEGGSVTLRDCWTAYGMSNPTADSQAALGMIEVTGGTALIDSLTYDRTSGVSQDVPVVAVNGAGAKARVFNVDVGTRGGTWTALPVARVINGGSLVTDDTTRKVTT